MSGSADPISVRSSLWTAVLQFIAAITGLVVTFVVKPPSLADQNLESAYLPMLNVICGVIFLFVLVFARRNRRLVHSPRMSFIAVVAVIAASASVIFYLWTANLWSCSTYQGDRLVIGSSLSPDASRYAAKNHLTDCADLIDEYARATDFIWSGTEMRKRYFLLLAWFLANVVLFTSAIIVAVEAAVGFLVPRARP